MAVNKADFLKFDLNQFAPNETRGLYTSWGLSAQTVECELDSTQADPIYPGDAVSIVGTSTGKLKVVAATATTPIYGFVVWTADFTKHVKDGEARYVTVLRDGGVMKMIADEALNAGATLYYDPADGTVTGTKTGLAPIGICLRKVEVNANGQLVEVEVVKPQPHVAA